MIPQRNKHVKYCKNDGLKNQFSVLHWGLGYRTSTVGITDTEAVSVSVQEGVSLSVLHG